MVSEEVISRTCGERGVKEIRVFKSDLADPRMQNIVLLAAIVKGRLFPDIGMKDYHGAMEDLMTGGMLEKNMRLFREEIG